MNLLRRIVRRFRPSGPLTPEGHLVSNLWIDKPRPERHLKRLLGSGAVTEEEAEKVRHFLDEGYLVLSLGLGEDAGAEIDADVERLWRERPRDVAYAYRGLLTPFSEGDADERQPSCRIADLHSASARARALYLDPRVFRMVDLLFGEPAVATQSLYFEWGSQQPLHRDPTHVIMNPPCHLLAAWIALEDVGPRCGPLFYIPGSHRLPYYQYEPGRYLFNHGSYGDAEAKAAAGWDREQCERAGLTEKKLTCRRGDVLIWHHSLLHGGSPSEDPELTRKSFVVHFSTLANMKEVKNTYRLRRDAAPEVLTSGRVEASDGCHGFESPLVVAQRVVAQR